MTDLRQAAQAVLDAWDDPAGMKHLCVAMDTIRTALEQQAEPVAWQYKTAEAGIFVSDQLPQDVQVWQDIEWSIPLYTTPPQRQWVGLTDEDFLEACQIAERGNYLLALQRIQIKLKERNT